MAIIKRLFLFLAINILVITTVSIIVSIFNLQPYLTHYGLDYSSLLIFCLIWGMTGSFISLLLSKKMAIWLMGVKIVNPLTHNIEEQKLLQIIKNLAEKANLKKVPEFGIYTSKEVNAFATGYSQRNSLIAVSTGLLNHLETEETKAVLAHEITHIFNGDMVTMTLLQGIINSFVMFLSRILAFVISGMGKEKNKNGSYFSYYILTFLFQTIFMFLGMIGICAFSRRREFKADLGGAKLAGKTEMINALKNLRVLKDIKDPISEKTAAINSFKISNRPKNIFSLFATHPTLEARIERLQNIGN